MKTTPTTDEQAPNLDLPEKEAFTVQEVADRWECSPETVIAYCTERKLVPAIRMHGEELEEYSGPPIGRQAPDWSLDLECSVFDSPPVAHYGLFYLWDFLTSKNDSGDLCIPLSKAVLTTSPDRAPPETWFRTPTAQNVAQRVDDLLVTRAERDRFEQRYMNPTSEESPPKKHLGTKERENLLRLVGLLTRLIVKAKNSKQLGKPEKPNRHQVVEYAKVYLQATEGLNEQGLSASNMEERIKQGLELIKSS